MVWFRWYTGVSSHITTKLHQMDLLLMLTISNLSKTWLMSWKGWKIMLSNLCHLSTSGIFNLTKLIVISSNEVYDIYANDYLPKIQPVANLIHLDSPLLQMKLLATHPFKHWQIFEHHLATAIHLQLWAEWTPTTSCQFLFLFWMPSNIEVLKKFQKLKKKHHFLLIYYDYRLNKYWFWILIQRNRKHPIEN